MNDLLFNFPKISPVGPGIVRLDLPTPGDPARYWFNEANYCYTLIAYQLPGDFIIVASSNYRGEADGNEWSDLIYKRVARLLRLPALQGISKLGLSGPEFLDRFNHDHRTAAVGFTVWSVIQNGNLLGIYSDCPTLGAVVTDWDNINAETSEEVRQEEIRTANTMQKLISDNILKSIY